MKCFKNQCINILICCIVLSAPAWLKAQDKPKNLNIKSLNQIDVRDTGQKLPDSSVISFLNNEYIQKSDESASPYRYEKHYDKHGKPTLIVTSFYSMPLQSGYLDDDNKWIAKDHLKITNSISIEQLIAIMKKEANIDIEDMGYAMDVVQSRDDITNQYYFTIYTVQAGKPNEPLLMAYLVEADTGKLVYQRKWGERPVIIHGMTHYVRNGIFGPYLRSIGRTNVPEHLGVD